MLVILLSGLALAVSLPSVVLGCECLLALLPLRRDPRARRGDTPRLAVVVPAHNEQAGISDTINAILAQLRDIDRLIVVADNCEDRTADVARSLGATVYNRTDDLHRGKGYAVRYALERLAADPPEVVVSVDADCVPSPNCIQQVARTAIASGHPVQAAYVMHPPADASSGTLVSALAVIVKNYIRPRGLQRLRMPCLITGSGVAYPWEVLQRVPHPKSHIVEDMDYSIDLALAGVPPLPCMEAVIESQLPEAKNAGRTQRTRWEHGHLSVILSQAPRLLAGAVRQRSLMLLALWCELIVPPLSLLVMITLLSGGLLAIACGLAATWTPLSILASGIAVGATGLTAAWWQFGRRALPPRMLLNVPKYILSKLSIYTKFLSSPEQTWVPTARDAKPASPAPSSSAPHFDVPNAPTSKPVSSER